MRLYGLSLAAACSGRPLFRIPSKTIFVWRCIPIASNSNSKELEINERIRDKEVRLIGADGQQMGVMSPRDALRIAQNQDLDLVKVAPQAKPPVCKILDYGKYRFEMQKKEKEARKNQKVVELKEIRLSLNIDTNDFNTKVNQAAKFLQQGHKVKVSIRFRGREMAHTNLGIDVHKRFAEALAGQAVVDKQPKLEGRSMLMFLSPSPNKYPQPSEAGFRPMACGLPRQAASACAPGAKRTLPKPLRRKRKWLK